MDFPASTISRQSISPWLQYSSHTIDIHVSSARSQGQPATRLMYNSTLTVIPQRQQMAKLICLHPKLGSGSSQAIICSRPSWAQDPQTEICPGWEMAKQICPSPKLGSGSPNRDMPGPGDGQADMPAPQAGSHIPLLLLLRRGRKFIDGAGNLSLRMGRLLRRALPISIASRVVRFL